MSKLKITLLRHAHTNHNGPPKIFQGRLDVDLSERGKKECIQLSGKFEWVKEVVASPAKRVRQTLEYTFGERLNQMQVSFDENLWEIDNGWFSGLSESQVERKAPVHYKLWCEKPDDCRPGGGETLDEMLSRALDSIEKIRQKYSCSEHVLVVTHGGIIRVLKLYYLNLSLSKFHELNVQNLDMFTLPNP